MRKITLLVWLLGVGSVPLLLLAQTPRQQEEVSKAMENVEQDCEKEIKGFCSQVTPGEGRIAACLYAYEDQLSPRCEYSLYDAASQLQQVAAEMAYIADACDADLDKFCSNVSVGDGHVMDCLNDHFAQLSPPCRQALAQVGE